jgi:threonyl-tRNA synthetase
LGDGNKTLIDALNAKGLPYEINEGDGAFYGPKIDVKIKDAIGRKWQCATIQCDFTLPARFDLNYIATDGSKQRPVMLHRVILGSVDRFLGVLIEHFSGAFPTWIAPVQAIIMNITDSQMEYAETVAKDLRDAGIRIELDTRNEKVGYKIREARLSKVPYMVIVGDKEKAEGTITVRDRSNAQKVMGVSEFITDINREIPKI